MKVFEDMLENKSHEFIAEKVADKLKVDDIIAHLNSTDVLNALEIDEVVAFAEEKCPTETFDFKGVKNANHDRMIETIQKCLDQFVDPNKMIAKLEELCK